MFYSTAQFSMCCSQLVSPMSPVIFVGPKFHNAVGTHIIGEMMVFGEPSMYVTAIANCGENTGTPDWA